MAKLETLQISGIRNFSPLETAAEKVRFSGPVTFFYGQNGSGKTTIIEALKFALTGDVPVGLPSGENFVTHPSVVEDSDTLGQVKLKLYDHKGNKLTVFRSLFVKQFGGGDLCKKSSAAKLRIASGSDKSDFVEEDAVNSEVCRALGVTKTVLNSVIFCPQEEAYWPLGSPKEVKQKFDEIFDCSKYVECIKLLGLERQKLKQKVVELIGELEIARNVKTNVEKEERQHNLKKNKLNNVENSIRVNQETLRVLDEKIKTILSVESEVDAIKLKIKDKKVTLEQGIIEISSNISSPKQIHSFEVPMDENRRLSCKQEIIEMSTNISSSEQIHSCEVSMDENQMLLNRSVDKIEYLDSEMEKLNVIIKNKQNAIEEISSRKSELERYIKEKNQLTQEIMERFQLQIEPNKEITVRDLENAMERIQVVYKQLCSDKQKETQELEKIVEDLKIENSAAKQPFKIKRDKVNDINLKVFEIEKELKKFNVKDEHINRVETEIGEISKAIENIKGNFDETRQQEDIDKMIKMLHDQELILIKLEGDLIIMEQNLVIEEQILCETKTFKLKEVFIKTLINKHSADLNFLFANVTPENNFTEALHLVYDAAVEKISEISTNVLKFEIQLTESSTKFSEVSSEIVKGEEQLSGHQRSIEDLCKGKSLEDLIRDCVTRKKSLQKTKSQLLSDIIMYQNLLSKISIDATCCPVCKRGFQERETAVNEIVKRLQNEAKAAPETLKEVDQKITAEEELNEKLQQSKTYASIVDSLNKEIPHLKEKQSEINADINRFKSEIDCLNEALEKSKAQVEIVQKLFPDGSLLDQNLAEIKHHQEHIDKLQKSLIPISVETTINDLKNEIAVLKNDTEILRAKCEEEKKSFHKQKGPLISLSDKRNALILEVEQLKIQLKEKTACELKLKEYKKNLYIFEQQVNDFIEIVTKLDNDLKKASENLSSSRLNNEKLLNEKFKEIEASNKLIRDFMELEARISSPEFQVDETELENIDEDLRKLRDALENLEFQRRLLQNDIDSRRNEIEDHEESIRKIAEARNEKLRELVSRDVEELQSKLAGFDHAALKEKPQFLKDKFKISREINTLVGQQKELRSSIEELEKELDVSKAYAEYRSKFYEVKVVEHMARDLQLYIKSLEYAVLEQHKERIARINQVIRDLWREVYTGNDIDYIEIQNDLGQVYNYKLVQVRKGVKIDMRAFCSSGQKMLASLVVRIALTEIFSANCGFLALDEPTNALDEISKKKLCDALAKILNYKGGKNNFHLLLITHDEEFLQTMSRTFSGGQLYKVFRNDDGFSKLKSETL